MDLEIVTVGSELLLGFTIDGNTADIGRLVAPTGCNLVRSSSVPDDEDAIRDAVIGGLKRTGLVVITGGLGPTADDITKKVVAGIFNAPLELDRAYLQKLERRFARLGRGPMPSANRCQAEIPAGATTLRNPRGTAPGLWLDGDLGSAIMLPGVPAEMRALMEVEVLPRLRQLARSGNESDRVTKSCTLRTTGISESQLAEDLSNARPLPENVTLSYLPGVDGVDLRLTIRGVSEAEADSALESAKALLLRRLGYRFYGEAPIRLSKVVIDLLRDARMRIAVAESCTGGMIGARLTDVPGASDAFAGGIICYENASKIRELGVPGNMLEESGAVSEAVALTMADGVCTRFRVDAGVAVTGIAGPDGGTSEKPVGTVWLAARLGTETRAVRCWFPGKRSEVRKRSAQGALDLVRRMLAPG
jgi:nicotinamide-nucleotide amidase